MVLLGCDFFSSLPLNEVEAAEVSVMAILRSIASGHYDGVPSVFSCVNSFPRLLGLAATIIRGASLNKTSKVNDQKYLLCMDQKN